MEYLRDAKRRQHGIATELYAQRDNCKPDIRDAISDLLGWIGNANEVQRMEDSGDFERNIKSYKYLEYRKNDVAVDVVNENGAKALEVYRGWARTQASGCMVNPCVADQSDYGA